ncbi:hypothetical protein [Nocardia inohanensis]|uniref:hypothetical protein n=1 Tax=Nocardia inohanensis TaxID=209246 RepID=UPI001FDEFB87|nr:hypothetical protein [Nocardia inohanensis]
MRLHQVQPDSRCRGVEAGQQRRHADRSEAERETETHQPGFRIGVPAHHVDSVVESAHQMPRALEQFTPRRGERDSTTDRLEQLKPERLLDGLQPAAQG